MSEDVILIENISKFFVKNRANLSTVVKNLTSFNKRDKNARDQELESNKYWALKDVNFSVKKNDAVGLVGFNGSGKSTLLKILSRIIEPTTGIIKIKGRVNSLLEVGTGFHSDLSGRDNIFLNGAILGMCRHEILEKFQSIVDYSEIADFIDMPVKYYSSGMYVRLAFSVAAHLRPEILFLDEVLAVGDQSFQKKCLNTLSELQEKGTTLIFVSHDIKSVQRLCNRSVLIHKGDVMCNDDTATVVKEYNKLQEGKE